MKRKIIFFVSLAVHENATAKQHTTFKEEGLVHDLE